MKRPEKTLPTILGLLVAAGGLVSGLWLVGTQTRGTKAAPEEAPAEVRITNVSDAGFVVSWLTDKAVTGFIQYGESGEDPNLVISDERDQQKGTIESYFTHFVNVRGLKPDTAYEFKIGSGKNLYDQNGQLYRVVTGPALSNTPTADVAYGQVVSASGDPAEGAIVYLQLVGGIPQAALVKSSGSWVIPLSATRTVDLSGYLEYDKDEGRIEITIQGGPMDTSTVITDTGRDSPLPQTVLGTNYDYLSDSAPAATDDTYQSKFSAPDPLTNLESELATTELNVLTPKLGEKVNTLRPEIIGEAPAGTQVTIEIHSTAQITGTVVADDQGEFTFSVPQDLEPGQHTLTITAVVDGVARKVTRSFTVFAQGESQLPAFSATPSGTLAPTATPTVTPKVTPTTKPLPTLKPAATPSGTLTPTPITSRPAYPATDDGVPVSGNVSSTLIVLAGGMLLVLGGGWWYKKAY